MHRGAYAAQVNAELQRRSMALNGVKLGEDQLCEADDFEAAQLKTESEAYNQMDETAQRTWATQLADEKCRWSISLNKLRKQQGRQVKGGTPEERLQETQKALKEGQLQLCYTLIGTLDRTTPCCPSPHLAAMGRVARAISRPVVSRLTSRSRCC